MFEHLIPNIVQKESSRKTSLTFYIIALLIAVGIFISSLGIDKGPLTSAYSYTFNKAEVQVNSKDNSMVPSVGNTSIFEFNILAKDNNTFLQKLKIYVQGLYKSTIFNDLKIYHNGVQLGYDAVFDNYGYLYFDLDICIYGKVPNLIRKDPTVLHAWWRDRDHTTFNSSIISLCRGLSKIHAVS